MKRIIQNKIMCRKCGEIIESKHRHDYQTCKCGACSVDGGHDYLRRCFKNRDDIIEMSEFEERELTEQELLESERRSKSMAMSLNMQDTFDIPRKVRRKYEEFMKHKDKKDK